MPSVTPGGSRPAVLPWRAGTPRPTVLPWRAGTPRPAVLRLLAALMGAVLLGGPAAWAQARAPVTGATRTAERAWPPADHDSPHRGTGPAPSAPEAGRAGVPQGEPAPGDTSSEAPGGWQSPLGVDATQVAPFDPPGERWLAGHRGLDLLAVPGTPVRAVADGVVSWVGVIAGVGSVAVLHDGGIRSTYQPLEAVVAVGQRVRTGDLLGRLALPGSHCAPAACLHLGALVDEAYLDPALLLHRRPARLLPLPLPPAGQT